MISLKSDRYDRNHFRRAAGEEDYYYIVQEKDDYDEYEEDEFV